MKVEEHRGGRKVAAGERSGGKQRTNAGKSESGRAGSIGCRENDEADCPRLKG